MRAQHTNFHHNTINKGRRKKKTHKIKAQSWYEASRVSPKGFVYFYILLFFFYLLQLPLVWLLGHLPKADKIRTGSSFNIKEKKRKAKKNHKLSFSYIVLDTLHFIMNCDGDGGLGLVCLVQTREWMNEIHTNNVCSRDREKLYSTIWWCEGNNTNNSY